MASLLVFLVVIPTTKEESLTPRDERDPCATAEALGGTRSAMYARDDKQKNDNLSLLQIAGLIDSFKKAQVLLSQNVNSRLILEQILLSLRSA